MNVATTLKISDISPLNRNNSNKNTLGSKNMWTHLQSEIASRARQMRGPAHILLVLLVISGACFAQTAPIVPDEKFDHFSTGFPLTGGHRQAACSDCHMRGLFKGTPRQCAVCHTVNGPSSASKKPVTHLDTTDFCEDCHTTNAWRPTLRVDHFSVIGPCGSCHNGRTAQGKGQNHITSGNNCDDCHTTSTFESAVFDHAQVTGACSSCHNGRTASGQSANHIRTSAQCDDCHSTRAWTPTSFDHDAVTGTCSSCHNGSSATGKPGTHIPTSAQCDTCHTTRAWTPARFEHSGVTGT
ncbi:MAG: hypothetical protein IT488_04770, partial [Gammaproteobacteria bacterium]|nr:hypothetical protein [Gammaproteobacteria bacterium]